MIVRFPATVAATIAVALLIAAFLIAVPWPQAQSAEPSGGTRGTGNGGRSAATTRKDKEESPLLRFRRIYAPEDRQEEWPGIADSPHLPMDAEEFEKLVKRMKVAAAAGPRSGDARATSAVYHAQLVGTQLTNGRATVEVSHAGSEPSMLPLDPCRLAIGMTKWVYPGKDPPETSEAVLGLGNDGRQRVRVERSARLEFTWSLDGHRDSADIVHFQVDLPECPSTRIVLDLPEDVTPSTDHGIVLPLEKIPGDRRPEGTLSKGFRRWQIELGGRTSFHLRVIPATAPRVDSKLALVRQSVVYDFSLRGVEVLAELNVEVHGEPIREIALAMDRELQLVSAECGDSPVAWAVDPESETKGATRRILLDLPEPIRDAGSALRLRALAPLATDRPWRLPRIQPTGMFWQEGRANLLVPFPLTIKQLTPTGCWQSSTGRLPGSREGESAQFQYFAPDATIEVVLSRRREPVQLLSATSVDVAGGEMTARVVTDLQISGAARFNLAADVPQRWLISSVESVPPEAIEDWDLERRGNDRGVLRVSLAQAFSPSRPIRLIVAARRLHSPLSTIGIEDLIPLRFCVDEAHDPLSKIRRLVAIQAVERYQIKLTGTEELDRVDPAKLDDAAASLFAELPKGHVFEDNANAGKLEISLEPQSPSYSGEVTVEAEVVDGQLREKYTFQCVPQGTEVDRVLAHFSLPREVPCRWSLGSDARSKLTAKKWSPEEQANALLPREGETWELAFQPRSEPFEIHAVRRFPFKQRETVALASLPDAIHQEGELVVRSQGIPNVRIENKRLKSVAAEPVAEGRQQTAIATFDFDPARDTTASDAGVVLHSLSEASSVPVWIWNAHLESRYSADGMGQHLATFHLQNSGKRRVRFTLPTSVESGGLREVWIGDKLVPPERLSSENGSITVDLPEGEKFPTVAIHFVENTQRLSVVGSVTPPLPTAEVPVFAEHWSVWLPPGYDTYGSDSRWQPVVAPRPSITRRVFGPVGQTRQHVVFDPFEADAWNPLAKASQREEFTGRARTVFARLGSAIVASPRSDPLRWATVLDQKELQSPEIRLMVDRHALATMGISAQTVIESIRGNPAAVRGRQLLQQASLALIVHADAVLLTSQSRAASYHRWLESSDDPTTYFVLSGPLSEQIARGHEGSDSPPFVSVAVWRRQAVVPRLPWNVANFAGFEASDAHGWSRTELEISPTEPVAVKYVHAATVQLFSVVVFLVVVGATRWKFSGRPMVLLYLAGGCALLAIWFSDAFAPIASAAMLGLLVCLILRLVRLPRLFRRSTPPPVPSQPSQPDGSQSKIQISTHMGAVFLAVVGLLGTEVQAAAPAQESSPHHVFIPIGPDEKPTGGKVYLPTKFYNQLRLLAADAVEKPQGWLLSGAKYEGTLARETGSERLVLEKLTASFDLNVFTHGARVEIPWQRKGGSLLPTGVTLDGLPIQTQWELDKGTLSFDVSQQGQYRLELTLNPTLRMAAGTGGFDVAIPPLATSRLELMLPLGVPKIDVPTAVGVVRVQDNPLRLIANLGTANRLSVRWPLGSGLGGTGSAVDVEELLWLKIQPGSVVVDARLKLKIVEGHLHALQLAADPRLRLLPMTGDDAPVAEVGSVPGQGHTVTFRWPEPRSGEIVLDASFLVTGTSGIGNLRLPEMKVLDARTTRRWVAVSLDPRLKHGPPKAKRVEETSVADFVARWGSNGKQPRAVYELALGEDNWSIATWANQPQTAVRQAMTVSFGEQRTAVELQASLVTDAGHNFQHRLLIPRELQGLRVESVSVTEGDTERVARFAEQHDRGGAVTVFLNGPVTGRQELTLRGHIPTRLGKQMGVAPIQIDRAQVLSSQVQLFRQPSVLITIGEPRPKGTAPKTRRGAKGGKPPRSKDNATGDNATADNAAGEAQNGDPDEMPAKPVDPRWGRFVAAYKQPPDQPLHITVNVARNRPDVQAEQVTWLRAEGMQWTATVDFRVTVANGVVDQFRIDAPSRVEGPYRVTGAIPATVRDAMPDKQRQLLVSPEKAIDGEYWFTLSSPVALSPTDRPFAPDIVLQRVGQLRRFVALPTRAQGQPILWETHGLKEAQLPSGFASRAHSGSAKIYEVVSKAFRAVVQRVDAARGTAQVRLADIALAWRADGTCYGVAVFDLEPGRSTTVPLRLPPEYELVDVQVAGLPALPDATVAGEWRIPLGPEQLPQRIEVLFRGTVPNPTRAGDHRFAAPTLGDLPVQRTLWTVAGPPMFAPGELTNRPRVAAWEHAFARVHNAASRIEAASLLTIEDPSQTRRWYARWANRMIDARADLRDELKMAPTTKRSNTAQSELLVIEQKQLQIARRLGTADLMTELLTEPPLADESMRLWERSLDRPLAVARCRFDGKAGAVTLNYRRNRSARSRPWLLPSLVVVLLLAAIAVGVQRGKLPEWFRRWPAVFGVAVGLVWWLWLAPSVVGLFIIAASLACAILTEWKTPPVARDSTIITIRSAR